MSDAATYDPQGDAAYDPTRQNSADVVEDGQSADLNPGKEDRAAAESESTGKIPRSEADQLAADMTPEEHNVSGRTRGVKVNAYQQEQELDKALQQEGVSADE